MESRNNEMDTEKNENYSWVVSVFEDPATGELMVPVPEQLGKPLGWNLGDLILWEIGSSQECTIRKVSHDEITPQNQHLVSEIVEIDHDVNA